MAQNIKMIEAGQISPLKFYQVKQQNFYVASRANYEIFISYNTVVGLHIDEYDNGGINLYEVKYSSTTSKQISKYTNIYANDKARKNFTAEQLAKIIKDKTGFTINCNYGGAR